MFIVHFIYRYFDVSDVTVYDILCMQTVTHGLSSPILECGSFWRTNVEGTSSADMRILKEKSGENEIETESQNMGETELNN